MLSTSPAVSAVLRGVFPWIRGRGGFRTVVRIGLGAGGLGTLLLIGFVAWPLPEGLLDPDGELSVRVTDRTGGLLRELPSPEDSRSVLLPRDRPVPPALRDAFIASEDRRFEHHPGVDPLAI